MEPSSIDIEPLGTGDGLKCPLCVDFLTSPRTLSCLHTFCERCLELHITDMKASVRDGRISSLFCPVCKQSAKTDSLQRSPHDIVSDFPLNKLMDQTTDEFPTPGVNNWRKDKKKFVHFTQLCGLCSKGNLKVKATSYCNGCGEFKCRRCTDKHVESDRVRQVDHDVVDIEEMSAITASKLSEAINNYTMCKEHSEQELRYYCTDHELLLCKDCDVTTHMRCRLADDFEGLSKSMSKLRESAKVREEMKGLQQDLGFMVETLRENNAEILKQSQSVSAKVHSMKATIIQLFEELEDSAAETIKRSREHVAKQNSGKAFKMKQLISAIEGSCSLLDSVSEHGTHRQLFTVFQKIKLQLQTYASLVKQEQDVLVRTSIIMDIDNDLESLISGFEKVGEVRLESTDVVIPIRKQPGSKSSELKQQDTGEHTENIVIGGFREEDSRLVRCTPVNGKTETQLKSTETIHGTPGMLSEKETQTDLNLNDEVPVSYSNEDTVTSTKDSGTQVKFGGSDVTLGRDQSNATTNFQNKDINHHEVQTQSTVEPWTELESLTNVDKSVGKSARPQNNLNSVTVKSKSDITNVKLKKDKVYFKGSSLNNISKNDMNSSLIPLSETLSQFETDISIMLDISSKLIHLKELKQENPNKMRHVIAVCTIKEAIILVFKTVKRTGISFNIVAFDLVSLTEFKTVEIKKDPKQIIAYDERHFAITFPDLGYMDFFSFKSGSPKTKKRPAVPADVIFDKSVKCDIRSAVLCKYRNDEFALSTSNYFGTLSHEGALTKLFHYSVSLRIVETNFWRTQLSVAKLVYDSRSDVIYAATSKPFKLFAFTVLGEVLSESVLDAAVTSLELDKLGNVYVCYNNGVDGVGRLCQIVTKIDGQRAVVIENKNPCFAVFSRETKRFHVVENQSSGSRIEEYELDQEVFSGDETFDPDGTDSVTTNKV